MYLEEIYLENTGPISKCHVEKMPFDEKGNPRPVVVVGANGSGKSVFLSYIVDALMEFAKRPLPRHGTLRWRNHALLPSDPPNGDTERSVL